MISPSIPPNEADRLRALYSYNILDTCPKPYLDDLVRLAAYISGAPISLISLVDADRCWFMANHGLADRTETPRDVAYASYAINTPSEPFIIEDALADETFRDGPLAAADPSMRFYVGVPLIDADGFALGTLCIIDHVPRQLSAVQIDSLKSLARQAVTHLKNLRQLRQEQRINDALRGKKEALEQYTSLISHDLQAPLRSVTGFAELLNEEYGDDLGPEARHYLRCICGSGIRMSEMITELLHHARLGYDLQTAPVSLDEVVADVLLDFSVHLRDNSVSVSVQELPQVTGGRTYINHLLQNLISNALKFARPGTAHRVSISASRLSDAWKVSVTDNGIGIPAHYQSSIFRMFERGDAKQHYDGMGVGLAYCQKIVDLHGGIIGVDSTAGQGSEFWFTLPR